MTSHFPANIPNCAVGPGNGDLILSTPGGRNDIVLEAADLGVTREVNQPATMSADIPLIELTRMFGTPWAMLGLWVRWPGKNIMPFAGVVTSIDADPASGVATVNCQDFTYYLDKRRLPKSNKVINGCAAGVADVLLKFAEMDDTLWISAVDDEDIGDLISNQLTGQGLLEQLQQNATDAAQEWLMDAARVFIWRMRLGADKRSSLQISEGIEISAYTPGWDASNIVNDLTMVPSLAIYEDRYAFRVQDGDSIAQLGRRQDEFVTSDSIRPSVLRSIGTRRLAQSTGLGRTLSVDLVNANGIYDDLDLGDTVMVSLPSINLAAGFRVLQLAYSLSDDVLVATGEIDA